MGINGEKILNNIVLIGFMGCGKTTIGKKLSNEFKYNFIDTDNSIKNKEKDILEIFDTKGESYFRECETELLKELLSENIENSVISTGGGMPLKLNNRDYLSKLGTIVYLKADANTIFNRIKGDNSRPLLRENNSLEKIIDMLAYRDYIYEDLANIIIHTDNLSENEIVSIIKNKVLKENL